MIEFAKLTGKSASPNLIQVKMRQGEQLYAPMAVMGNSVSMPSAAWIAAHKDEFLALVTFEHEVLKNPVVIGFYPVKGADSTTYNVTEKLLDLVKSLIDTLGQAKVLTQLGPQQFMADTLVDLQKLTAEIETLSKDINTFSE